MRKYFIATLALCAIAGPAFLFVSMKPLLYCSPGLLSKEWYIAYCEPMKAFNDQPAMLFNIDGTLEHAQTADVLIFGNSTTQAAFSNVETNSFFQSIGASYFVFGFGGAEGWELPNLIARIHGLHPKVAVFNISGDWFQPGKWAPGTKYLLQHPLESYVHTVFRAWYQKIQLALCDNAATKFPCAGTMGSVYRSRLNGTWNYAPDGRYDAPREVRYGCKLDASDPGPNACGNKLNPVGTRSTKPNPSEFLNGRKLIERLAIDPQCVAVTASPISTTETDRAREIAARLGAVFIDVDKSGLYTTDESHLFLHSAETYTKRFLAKLAPMIERCKKTRAPGASAHLSR